MPSLKPVRPTAGMCSMPASVAIRASAAERMPFAEIWFLMFLMTFGWAMQAVGPAA
jgi:hypothetical protein